MMMWHTMSKSESVTTITMIIKSIDPTTQLKPRKIEHTHATMNSITINIWETHTHTHTHSERETFVFVHFEGIFFIKAVTVASPRHVLVVVVVAVIVTMQI